MDLDNLFLSIVLAFALVLLAFAIAALVYFFPPALILVLLIAVVAHAIYRRLD